MADNPKTTAQTCAECLHWSEDDDGDGRGCCAVKLNDFTARGWRTTPDFTCLEWKGVTDG
jgi:hypothetical protein